MFALSWDVQELTQLISVGRSLYADVEATLEIVKNPAADYQQCNIPRKLSSIRSKYVDLMKRIIRFKRSPATHVFTFMISSELRNKKPYALPVQCFPYDGLKENDLRRLITQLIKEMVAHGMKVAGRYMYMYIKYKCIETHAGFVSDGEFNYLRTKGYTRPLSVIQIRSDVRRKYSRMSHTALLSMLTPTGSCITITA